MKTKQIGTTDLRIPPIAFGCNVLGWTMDKKQSFRVLDELYEMGFNYMDTADVYSRWVDGHEGGESERILGAWMKERGLRDRIIVATKVGMDVGQGHIDLSRQHINKQIDKSLENLQTDYVDIYFSHRHDENTAVENVLETYADLIKQGKIRHIGASSFPLDTFKEAIQLSKEKSLPKYQVYQPEYSLLKRTDFENGYQEFVMKNNVAITNYWALANGFLTGKYESVEDIKGSSREKNLKKYFDDRGKRVLKALKKVSDESGISQAGVTIAWTMAQPGITAPIVSATKISQLEAFKEAASHELSQELLDLLNEASDGE
ncbi:Predicted oxidoreductase [Nonlabens sp. Hel1_33_55]|uniref:aldo/keto reductase n=1 Tax=Nonlabens sp. Hel1_33_55 TaxID=1336802 RepID=UPI000875B64B|nr:aldo/keto reductase [Nonlabens sp. Hel1_33_55]SCY17846.1 Predicted oxidoreductase [Nonlabens sp. Hel1_33_55]